MISVKNNAASKFCRSANGNVTIVFGFAALVITGMAGLAIDGGRAYSATQKASAALDAAALAGAKALQRGDLDDDGIKNVATSWMQSQFLDRAASQRITVQNVEVGIDRGARTVTVELTARIANHFGPLFHMDTFQINSRAAATYGVTSLELGLMLDVSGSMQDYGKIDDLKDAVGSMVDILMPENDASPNTRIGIAPYSSAVNSGVYSTKVRSGSGKCVSERRGADAFSDHSATGALMGTKASSCPSSAIQPITSDRATLLANVDALQASGNTAGHLGAAWAWYLVSPNWADIWPAASKPAAYGEKGTYKAVVLMTDGMFNTAYESTNGTSDQQARQLCSNMKAAGVTVFTIGFQAPATVVPTLRDCASSAEYFHDASDASALTGAFRRIADELSQLRLSR